MDISGKSILVSGGGSGLGEATARLLADSGAKVVIGDINREKGEALAAELGEDRARFVAMNVTSEESVQEAVSAAIDAFGGLHAAINCAGIGLAERTVSRDGPHALASFTRVVTVNLIGTFNVIRLAAAAMSGQEPLSSGERGVIVNTASIAAFDGQIGQAAYSASKGGIVGLTLPVARDLSRLGIRVATIAPGIFDTPLLGTLPDAVREALGSQVPFPSRLGRPAEFAALVKHIIENEMINGEVIRIDGALRMPPK
ncbi:MAG: 3-hydroxyacyl-CoA dehydrogenase [Acidobacteria bacterium]|nr:3-hydroxyacyl-CoA dehydrogenase [Acidobacteriota bacterium]MCW5967354.1 3-hydroxyacyl-CoA dehydrogenase [Blastocatellales bacterium]